MTVSFCTKMKIGIVTEYFPRSENCESRGGIETRCFYVAKELAQKHDVTVICSREPGAPREQTFNRIKVIRCGSPKEHCHLGSIRERLSFMRQAYTLGIGVDSDLIEGADFVSYLPAYYIAKKKRVLGIAWYNDVWIGRWIHNTGLFQGLMGEILERFVLTRDWSYFVANSEFTLKNLLNQRIKKEKLRLIHCGVDLERCFSLKVYKEKRPTICCVSRLVPYKKINILIEAVSHVKKEMPDIQCWIIGIGPERRKLEKLTKELDLRENINFLGFIESYNKVLEMIKRSHVLCLPSVVEGFGIVVIEAMACSTPYVCSRIPPLKEITDDGTGGLLFEKENPRDLAQKLLLLLKNKELYDKCVREGLKLAPRYDWAGIAREIESFYKSCLKKNK